MAVASMTPQRRRPVSEGSERGEGRCVSSSQRVQRGVNVAIIGVGFTLMLHFLYQAATSICRGLRNGLDAGIYLLAITLQNSIIPSDRTTHQPPPTPTPPVTLAPTLRSPGLARGVLHSVDADGVDQLLQPHLLPFVAHVLCQDPG